MIEIVINYDPDRNEFKAYEPRTDTIFITSSLGETFIKLDEYLKQHGIIVQDILKTTDIIYHIDSYTFLAMIENNVNLLKRLNQAPSGFQISSQRFGIQNTTSSLQTSSNSAGKNKKGKKKYGGGTFSKSSFNGSMKKFGTKN